MICVLDFVSGGGGIMLIIIHKLLITHTNHLLDDDTPLNEVEDLLK
jgi:hypothetical protein